MTLDLEYYAWREGVTPLSSEELNKRFYALVRRLHDLEQLKMDWSESVAQVQNHGLARINEAVAPLVDGLRAEMEAVIALGQTAQAEQAAAVAVKLAEMEASLAAVEGLIAGLGASLDGVLEVAGGLTKETVTVGGVAKVRLTGGIAPMTGATATTAGTAGSVSAPAAGDQNKCWFGGAYWGYAGQPWTPGVAFTRSADATFMVTDNAANQDTFRAGRPLRFRQNAATAWQYAMVRAYAAGTVTLGGAPLAAAIGADAGREIQYGDMTRLHPETLVFNGYFADSADATLIANDLVAALPWPKGKAYLVHFKVKPRIDDTGAAQARVNVTLAGNAVSTSSANAGLSVIDTGWTETTTDINTATYGVTLGQAVEVSVDNNSTNKDARDLTVIATWVQE